jgi:hypothetical protein
MIVEEITRHAAAHQVARRARIASSSVRFHTRARRGASVDYLFTPAFVNSFNGAMPIIAGFTFESDEQIVRPNLREDTGARNGPGFAKKRRISSAGIQVVNTQGMEIGTNFTDQIKPVYFKNGAGDTIPVNQLYSDIHWQDSLSNDYSFDGMIAWRIRRAYPASVASIGGFIQTHDK